MSELAENQFRTSAGVCAITPKQIIFSRESIQAVKPARLSFLRGSSVYVVLGSLLFGFGIFLLLQGDMTMAIVLMMLGMGFPWLSLRSREAPALPAIERKKIRRVEVHRPVPPLIRGYLTIHFEDDGKLVQQRIVLPSSFSSGSQEFERAVQVMRAAGLLAQD